VCAVPAGRSLLCGAWLLLLLWLLQLGTACNGPVRTAGNAYMSKVIGQAYKATRSAGLGIARTCSVVAVVCRQTRPDTDTWYSVHRIN
jgi:hypothetical protein